MKIIKEKKIEESNMHLTKYLGQEYKNYEFGDPVGAASFAAKTVNDIEKLVKNAAIEIDKAGKFLSPAILASFKKDLDDAIKFGMR